MNEKTDYRSRKRKRLIVILSALTLIILIVVLSFDRILEGIVKRELNSQLRNPENSLYQFRFDNLRLGVLSGNLKITGLEILPTDSASNLLHSGKIKSLIHTRAQSFEIENFRYMKLIRNGIMKISSVRFSGIDTEYIINPEAKKVKQKNTSTLHELFSDEFQEADVETIQIQADKIHFRKLQDSLSFFQIDSISLQIDDVLANQETLEQTIPVNFKNIQLSSGHFSMNSMENYEISTESIDLDILDSKLTINGFQLKPKYSREDFNNKIRYNDDLFSIRTKSIVFNDLQLTEFASEEIAHIHSLTIEEPEIEIYRDKRLPDAPFKYKPLLAGSIHKIPLNILVDSLLIRQGKLSYEEQTDVSDQPGKVFFDPFYISAYNITNDSVKIAENSELLIDFQGNIMAAATLKSSLDIDLSSKNESFTVRGSLEPVSGTVFNPMVENLLPVTIHSGDVSRTEYYFMATDNASMGQLILEYENLKVDVQKKKDHNKKATLISLVANGLVKGKNLPEQGSYNRGSIQFERRKDRAIVNYLWKSIQSGIISIIAPIADPNKNQNKTQKKESRKENRKGRSRNKN
jgi:hypothetical protein